MSDRDLDDTPRAAWAERVATHRRIDGRRWRVSDPRIPEDLRQRLVDELMGARRAVRAASSPADERAARDRVQGAKVALGERGLRWWHADLDHDALDERIRRTAAALHRGGTPRDELVAAVVAVTSASADRVGQVLQDRASSDADGGARDQRSGR